jgi:hypothetical protein
MSQEPVARRRRIFVAGQRPQATSHDSRALSRVSNQPCPDFQNAFYMLNMFLKLTTHCIHVLV